MKKKILILSDHIEGTSGLLRQQIEEQYGKDVEIYTVDEAREAQLTMHDFDNIPTMQITASPLLTESNGFMGKVKTGQQNRRERRVSEHKTKKQRRK